MAENEPDRRAEAESPTGLKASSWWAAVRRVPGEFTEDNLSDWAAALTYYGVLSIFPALLVIVSLVGLAGKSVSDDLVTNVRGLAPGPVREILVNALTELQRGRASASLIGLAGLAAALWSASKYVAAFMRASNDIYDVREGRPIWKTLPIRVAITLVTVVLLAACAIAVVVTGALARKAGDLIGAGSTVVTVWDIAKWPVLLIVVDLLFALLYWASPNAKQVFRWVTPGGVLAMLLWLAASAGFAGYVTAFSSYNKTYGSLAALIVFLIWLWFSNLALLLGAELNAELERSRAIAAGLPPRKEPYLPLREEPAATRHERDAEERDG